ncbi:MAG: efflux RND transporter periplasmic adaptor subunit [Gemmataceae bacterium]
MRRSWIIIPVVAGVLSATAGTLLWHNGYLTSLWRHGAAEDDEAAAPAPHDEKDSVRLSEQAVQALGVLNQPIRVQPYWKTIEVPGMVVDRPGFSDRGVTAPVAGTVAQVHAFPGDTLRPGDRLFTLRLVSEYVQNAQSELFKTARELQLNREQVQRLSAVVAGGAVSHARLIELENQERRLRAAMQALRHDLLARGLTTPQVDGVQEGQFVTEVTVVAPPPHPEQATLIAESVDIQLSSLSANPPLTYEVQELRVELGQQVQAGQALAVLANHQALYIEGRAFKSEAAWVAHAARHGWPVQVEFGTDAGDWEPLEHAFVVRSIGNVVDPESRTLPFYLPLVNQWHSYERDGQTFLTWRFRPGQRVRLYVPIERLDNAIVLPAEAVVREGVEAYVFRQNGDQFDRKPVRVLYEDRRQVALAQDGDIFPGLIVAHNGAAALQRALKASQASGSGGGGHWHADGTYHEH